MSTRVFISFDYDHDADLKNMLVGQSRNPDSPFEISDWSIKDASPSWRSEAKRRIEACNIVAVLCGVHTASAIGVAAEVKIAQEDKVPYFLLQGRSGQTAQKPTSARPSDTIYDWTWSNLKWLIGGSR